MNITSLSRAASLLLLLPIPAPLPGNSAPVSAERIVFPAKMAVRIIRDFGAKGDGRTDDTEALRQAINAGGFTYFPNGTYLVSDSVVWTGKPSIGPTWQGESREGVVIRLAPGAEGLAAAAMPKPVVAFIPMGGKSADFFKFNMSDMTVDAGKAAGTIGVRFHSNNNGTIRNVRIVGEGSPVVFDGMDRPLGKYLLQIETCGGRDVFIRRLRGNLFAKGAGNVFLQDSVSAVHISHPEAKVWAWQLNSESAEGVNVVNDGGQLWVLGLKTERNQVLIETKSGGRTEVLGGWIYNTVRTDPAECMFSAIDSRLSLASLAYYNNWQIDYPLTVKVKRDGRDFSLTPAELGPAVTLYSTESR